MVPSLWSLMGQSAQSVDPVGLAPSQPASLPTYMSSHNSGKPSISSLILGRNFMFFQLAAFPSYLKPRPPPSLQRPTKGQQLCLVTTGRSSRSPGGWPGGWTCTSAKCRELPGGVAFTQPAVTSCLKSVSWASAAPDAS